MSKRLNLTSFIICLIFTASLFSISTTTVSAKPCHKRTGATVTPADATKNGTGTSCRRKEARQLALTDYYKNNCGNMPNCVTIAKCRVWKKKQNSTIKRIVKVEVACIGSATGGKVAYEKIDDDECKPVTGKAVKYTATASGRAKCKCSCPYLSPDAPAC